MGGVNHRKETNVPAEESQFTIIDTPGYAELFGAVADFVHGTPQPRLAAAAVLNAICAVGLTTMPGAMLADLLRQTADRIPAEEAKARNQLS